MQCRATDQTAQGFQGLKGGEVQEFLTIENDFSNIKKSDILEINKGWDIVSTTRYTLTKIRGTRPEW